ncbi:hypothetical protein Kpol_1004p1, partial [Vanderwaltozyma polyspora DSM 70294]
MIFGLQYIFLWIACLRCVFGEEISNVEFSSLEYTPLHDVLYPHLTWSTSLKFNLPDASLINEGDHFTLTFSRVYRAKFDGNNNTFFVSLDDGTNLFQCLPTQQAAYLYNETVISCYALTPLYDYQSLSGVITLGLSFNNGDRLTSNALENAKFFHSGEMDLPIHEQLSASITFEAATFNDVIYAVSRTTTYDSLESYFLSMKCENGFLVGGTQEINFDVNNGGYTLDCSSIQTYISDKYNDWWFPTDYEDSKAEVYCFGNNLWITMPQTKPNFTLWVNALQYVPEGQHNIRQEVSVEYTCSNTIAHTQTVQQFSTLIDHVIDEGKQGGIISGQTKMPVTTTTTTTGWTGSFTSTYSTESTFTVGTDSKSTPEVVIHVETPSTKITTTTTTGWTGSFTSTYSTESTFTVGTDSKSTPEVVIHVETPSTK